MEKEAKEAYERIISMQKEIIENDKIIDELNGKIIANREEVIKVKDSRINYKDEQIKILKAENERLRYIIQEAIGDESQVRKVLLEE